MSVDNISLFTPATVKITNSSIKVIAFLYLNKDHVITNNAKTDNTKHMNMYITYYQY